MPSRSPETKPKAPAKKAPKKAAKKPSAAGVKKAPAKRSTRATKIVAPGKPLVIVESPAKARTINKILGNTHVVRASMGHVRDLPATRFGIDIENDFAPTYRTIRGRTKTVKELRAAAKGAPTVFLASDPDREGEAIAWHLAEELHLQEDRLRRVVFHEITARAVQHAFDTPGRISMDMVNAQQARRVLDRIVGYRLSPLLWKKIARGLSAGRVQSVATMLIVDREKEIRAFQTEEYWSLTARVRRPGDPEEAVFGAELKKLGDQDVTIPNEETARALVEELSPGPFRVEDVQTKRRKDSPPPPYTTSLLQQQASTRLHFSAKKTMMLAQQLYEGIELGPEGSAGLITYMRTDSFRIADEAIQACRETVRQRFGDDVLEPEVRVYRSKKSAQGAHEAIRPTDPSRSPEDLAPFLSRDQLRLYEIIWKRFIATQMKPALWDKTEARILSGRGVFSAKGRVLLEEGYLRIAGRPDSEDDPVLPPLESGMVLDLVSLDPEQHFTQPPPRFTEASLVKELEKHEIGRPSTYAPIISTIQDRGYVTLEKRRFHATELGIIVTEKLVEHFADILNVNFTASVEEKLDLVEEGKADWRQVLREFYDVFERDLTAATEKMTSVRNRPAENGENCVNCGKPMVVRWTKTGRFLGCSGYPDCKTSKPMDEDVRPVEESCDICGRPMTIKMGRRGRFVACTGYPECKRTKPIAYLGRKTPDIGPIEPCEDCGKEMMLRYGRRGPFLGCTGYPDCKRTRPLPKVKSEEPA